MEFVSFDGTDGMRRAVHRGEIRLLADEDDGDGGTRLAVTLCDGTQFYAVGSVESTLTALGETA